MGGISHFIATNEAGQIYVMEIPSGNPTAAHLLVGPHLFGSRADLVPVRQLFVGNWEHPDLLIEVQGVSMRFVNTGKSYVPTTASS